MGVNECVSQSQLAPKKEEVEEDEEDNSVNGIRGNKSVAFYSGLWCVILKTQHVSRHQMNDERVIREVE